MISDSITIFTDGSSRGNPGPGGYAAVVILPEQNNNGGNPKEAEVIEIGGREEYTTNNRMELIAVIKALQQIQDSRFKIQVFSDSSYVINGITKWVFGWQKNNWITSTKTPVENRDLWENLIETTAGKNIKWGKVGGHIGIAGNERCDEIATTFADGLLPKLYVGSFAEYPIKNILNVYDISYKKQESKISSSMHSKAKAYSYVSMVEGKILTHKTWAECEHLVKGKSGARYKKALTAQDEKEIIKSFSK